MYTRFFQDKVSGVAAYILWLLGSLCLLGTHFIEGRVVTEVHASSKMLPGHSQRLRAFSERTSNTAYVIGFIFFVIGAVQWASWQYRSVSLPAVDLYSNL